MLEFIVLGQMPGGFQLTFHDFMNVIWLLVAICLIGYELRLIRRRQLVTEASLETSLSTPVRSAQSIRHIAANLQASIFRAKTNLARLLTGLNV